MTFESLSALPLTTGATPAPKMQESVPARPDRGGSFQDFSSVLTQAMQTQHGPGTRELQRQALAESATRAPTDSAASPAAPAKHNADTASRTESSRSLTRDLTSANQELAQRARRITLQRAAAGRGREVPGETPATDNRTRRAGSRRADDKTETTASNGVAAMPPHALAVRAPASQINTAATTSANAQAVDTAATAGTGTAAADLLAARTSHAPSLDTAPLLSASVAPDVTAGTASAGLTTLTLSPHLNILTPAQGIVSEQSLQAFAQSMGIEASQFKQLQSPDASVANAAGIRAGVTASDAQLSALLPSMATPEGQPIDLSQVLPEGMSLQDLQIDLQGMPRRNSGLDAASPSTLDVLGMREGSLTVDAVPGLQDTAQTGTGEHSPDQGGAMANAHTQAAARTEAASGTNAAQPAARSMTEHFEKLSAKLATEMAARVHEQFSQGEWKMKFALKPASLGQVDVQLEMRDGKLAAVFQADNPMTQDLLQNGSQRLRDALNQMGLSQSSVWVGDGRGQASQHGDRHGGSRGEASSVSQRQAASQEPAQTVSAPRRDSLSQLDFYA